MSIKIAIAHLVESRSDFLARRQQLVEEEIGALKWLHQKFSPIQSDLLKTEAEVREFARQVNGSAAECLIIHIPIWTEPILTLKLCNLISLPVLLLGNMRPETSSIVGLLGAGGALDQVGCKHERVFNSAESAGRRAVTAFIYAAATSNQLRGQTLGLFGSRSLGIFTTVADPAQWHKLFKLDLKHIDQSEIKVRAESLPEQLVSRHTSWLLDQLSGVEFGDLFNPAALERQVRSYLATRQLVEEYGLDFVGVKCQPELSDGYASQCISHMLMNGSVDADGIKAPVVHACESDADGALTMQILKLISGGRPAALLDLRWFDAAKGTWIVANCGAIPASFCAKENDPGGLSSIRMMPHVFGRGGGGALPGIVTPQQVTLARLCRKNGEYLMFIVSGEVLKPDPVLLSQTTAAFPQALIKTSCGMDFLQAYGSNHIHMVSECYIEAMISFCRLSEIPYKLWV